MVDTQFVVTPLQNLGHLPRNNINSPNSLAGPSHLGFNLIFPPLLNAWIGTSSSGGVHFFASIPGPREHLIPWQRGVGLINFSLFSFEPLGLHTHTHIHTQLGVQEFNGR
jgi:hypothetical protein